MSADIINEGETVPPGSSSEQADSRSPVIQWIQIAILTLLIGCAFFGIGWWRSGGMSTSFAYLQGERLIFTPANIIIEDAKPGDIVERTIVVNNLSGKTITLLGSQKSCGCITLNDFPIEIKPYGRHKIQLIISMPEKTASLDHEVKFFSDDKGYGMSLVTVTGNVK